MKVLNFNGCYQEQINNVTEFINDNHLWCRTTNDNTQNLIVDDSDVQKIKDEHKFDNYDFNIIDCTYDLCFDDEVNVDYLNRSKSYQECKDYIKKYNGTDEIKYFKDYRGGYVAIYCNELADTVYEETII